MVFVLFYKLTYYTSINTLDQIRSSPRIKYSTQHRTNTISLSLSPSSLLRRDHLGRAFRDPQPGLPGRLSGRCALRVHGEAVGRQRVPGSGGVPGLRPGTRRGLRLGLRAAGEEWSEALRRARSPDLG